MSAQSDEVEIVRTAIEAWNHRDLEALAQHVDPALEWIEIEEAVDMSDRQGRTVIERVTRDLEEAFEGYQLDPESIESVGDGRLVAVVRESGRGRSSGAEMSSTWGYVITLREDKIAKVEAFRDPSAVAATVRKAAARAQ